MGPDADISDRDLLTGDADGGGGGGGGGATLKAKYEAGASLRALAAQEGTRRDVVRRQLLAAGVQLRQKGQLPIDPRWWGSRVEAGRSNAEIAAEIQVHPDTVSRHLRTAGLRRRADQTNHTFHDWLRQRVEAHGQCVRRTGAHTNSGYGATRYQGRKCLVHRLVWEQHHGPILAGHELTRTSGCAWSDCVNLDHLVAMTPTDRISAKVAASVFAHGEQHWNAHLTETDVDNIRASSAQVSALATHYGVHPQTITSIRRGHRWKHLLRPQPADTGPAVGPLPG